MTDDLGEKAMAVVIGSWLHGAPVSPHGLATREAYRSNALSGATEITVPGDVLDVKRYHVLVMAQTIYQVFVQQDGNYGVALSQLGAMVRTATGFSNVSDAHVWIEVDGKLEHADNPFRERDPANPQGH